MDGSGNDGDDGANEDVDAEEVDLVVVIYFISCNVSAMATFVNCYVLCSIINRTIMCITLKDRRHFETPKFLKSAT